MNLSDFDYQLPTELIAQKPLGSRTASRLLRLKGGGIADHAFADLGQFVQPGDLLVVNNTKVIPARLFGQKESGGAIEVLIEQLLDDRLAHAHVRASKSPRAGTLLLIAGRSIRVEGRKNNLFVLRMIDTDWDSVLTEVGRLPLPPYIQREQEPEDVERYQTVYAKLPGAVAAPTAGLHFDGPLLEKLTQLGVDQAEVTLHVGAGTFQPVREENLDHHQMHFERVTVTQDVIDKIRTCKESGGKVIAVGTTVVRSLESATASGELSAFSGETNLFIRPGYQFKVVDRLITNFHLPKSTLLMLVSAFSGFDEIKTAYQHAITARYRFFSYGDAMLLDRKTP